MRHAARGFHGRSSSERALAYSRALVTTLGLLLGVALLFSAVAVAAAPEPPDTEAPTGASATTATFHGVLNPAGEGEAGTYEFAYRASKTECQGGGFAPEPPGLSFGFEHEEVSQEASGLEPGTEYTVCLVARNGLETVVGSSVTFKTAIPPETPAEEEATEVTGTTAKLKGVLNLHGEGEPGLYYFTYAPSTTTCEGEEYKRAPAQDAASSGHEGEAVEVPVSELLPHATYTFCLTVFNGASERAQGPPVTFTTSAMAPVIGGAVARPVGATTATLRAEISPGGRAASYRAEYVTEAQFLAHEWAGATRVPLSDAELPASSAAVPVTESVGGLRPSTAYRFRFVAANSLGGSDGAGAFATTPSAVPASTLPDGRVVELVSTSGGYGEPYTHQGAQESELSTFLSPQPFQAALAGDAVAYIGEPASSGGNGNTGDGEGNQWLARRASSGWVTGVISPETDKEEFLAFSADLSVGFVLSAVQPPLAPGAPAGCHELYSRATDSGAYAALLTSIQTPGDCGFPLYAGATEDGARVFLQSEAALTPDAHEATEIPPGHSETEGHAASGGTFRTCMFGCNLYEAAGGSLRLVNVLPDGETAPSANFGGYAGDNPDKANFGGAISADGSRVFWTDTQAGPEMGHVYVLEDRARTVQVSGGEPAEFWAASRDGRVALYVEGERLWRFDTSSNTRQALTDPGAGVQGVIGINEIGEDGAYVYFVASGVLTTGENAHHETAQAGEPNLYLLRGGSIAFIATLSPADNHIRANPQGRSEDRGDWVANLGDRTAEVTPDGRHVVFQSLRALTGYDNADAVSLNHEKVSEVFVYAADQAALACASCDPTGAPPQVFDFENLSQLPVSNSNTSMSRWISASGGRVFFNAIQPLAAQDQNGNVQDVYEWEAAGEGTCTQEMAGAVNDGCVFLLSGGNSEDYSYLLDADANGENVFFTHRGGLGLISVSGEPNELYDARVDGGFASPLAGCAGVGCQLAPPGSPTFATPASALASTGAEGGAPGPALAGSTHARKKASAARIRAAKLKKALKACKKERRKARLLGCEKRARTRYGSARGSKAANNGRRAQS